MGRPKMPKDDLYDLWYHKDYYEKHSVPNRDNDCVEWDAGMHNQGYGMCGAWRKTDGVKVMTVTHRIAARLKYQRAIDTYEFVLHTCGNPACVNPDHLEIGDSRDVQLHRYQRQRGTQVK